jgi:PAS domain S-box-containing protein
VQDRLELFRDIFEHCGAPIVVDDADGRIRLANPCSASLTGYAREEIEGKLTIRDFLVPEEFDRVSRYHRDRRLDPGAAPSRYETRIRTKRGDVVSIEITVALIPGTSHSVASILDVTERAAMGREQDRRIVQLSVLSEIGNSLSSTLEMDRLIRLIHEQAARVMDASNFFIALHEEERNEIAFPLYVDANVNGPRGSRPYGKGITEHILSTRKTLSLPADVMGACRKLGIEPVGRMARSWLGVPMIAKGRALGVVAVQSYDREAAYTDDDRLVLEMIASQAAIAIDNARLYRSLSEQMTDAALLYDVGRVLIQTRDPREIVDRILTLLQGSFGFALVSVLLLDEQREYLRTTATKGYLEASLQERIRVGEEGITGTAAASGEIVNVPDVAGDSRYIAANDAVRSEIAVPLRTGGEVIGVLNVESTELAAFGAREERLLGSFSSIAAVAIENARLYAGLESRVREMDLINQITLRVNAGVNLEETLSTIVEELRRLFHCHSGRIYLLDETGAVLVPKVVRYDRDRYPESFARQIGARRIALGHGITGTIGRTGQALIVNDALADPRTTNIPGTPERDESLLGSPLLLDDRVIGVILLSKLGLRQFQEADLRLLSIVANQAALAIKKAHLLEETRRAYDDLRSVQDRLVQSERIAAVTDTVATLNHEINNPLASILGNAQLLLRKGGISDPALVEKIRRIVEDSLRIKDVTTKMAGLIEAVTVEYPGNARVIDVDRSAKRRSA